MPGPIEDNTPLQRAFREYNLDADRFYGELAARVTELIGRGVPLNAAVDRAFRDLGYADTMGGFYGEGLTVSAKGATYDTPIRIDAAATTNYFMKTEFFGDAALSSRLNDGTAQRIVKESMKDFFTKKRAVQTLFGSIRDGGYTSFDGLPQEITGALHAFEATGSTSPTVVKEITKARAYVESLSGVEASSAQLKRAYSGVLTALERDESGLVSKAVDRAVTAKVGYNNKRIARSEFSRAYNMTFERAIQEDDGIIGYKVVLSSRHFPPDICDCYAEADLYGLGPGVYPKGVGANIPFHPNCLCGKIPVRRLPEGSGQFSAGRLNNFLSGLPEGKRKKIVGAKYATNQNNYIKGLTKNGFRLTAAPKMIPKDLFTLK